MSSATMTDLPWELLEVIFMQLDVPTAVGCQRLCKYFRRVASSDKVLRALCEQEGYLPRGKTIEDLRRPARTPKKTDAKSLPFSKKGRRIRTVSSYASRYPQYKIQGRKDDDFSSYSELLCSSWSLQQSKSSGPRRSTTSQRWKWPNKYTQTRTRYAQLEVDLIEHVAIVLELDSYNGWVRVSCLQTGQELAVHYWEGLKMIHNSQGWLIGFIQHNDDDEMCWFVIWCFEQLNDKRKPRRGRLVRRRAIEVQGSGIFHSSFDFPHLHVTPHPSVLEDRDSVLTYNVVTGKLVRELFMGNTGPEQLVPSFDYITTDSRHIWITLETDTEDEIYYNGRMSLRAFDRKTAKLSFNLDDDVVRVASTLALTAPAQRGNEMATGWTTGRLTMLCVQSCLSALPEHGKSFDMAIERDTDTLCVLTAHSLLLIPRYKRFVNSRDFDASNHQHVLQIHCAQPETASTASQPVNSTWRTLAAGGGAVAFLSPEGQIVLMNLKQMLPYLSRLQRWRKLRPGTLKPCHVCGKMHTVPEERLIDRTLEARDNADILEIMSKHTSYLTFGGINLKHSFNLHLGPTHLCFLGAVSGSGTTTERDTKEPVFFSFYDAQDTPDFDRRATSRAKKRKAVEDSDEEMGQGKSSKSVEQQVVK